MFLISAEIDFAGMEFSILCLLFFSVYHTTAQTSNPTSTLPAASPTIPPSMGPAIEFNSTGIYLRRDVLFFLFTRENPQNQQQLFVGDSQTLMKSAYNFSLPTTFSTHGWTSSYDTPSCTTIRDGFLAHGLYNVILVDWSSLSKTGYVNAATRVKSVGSYVAKMVDYLVSLGSNPNNMTLVGHSLGAHVMGLAGHLANSTVSHVVGLDPAAPGFHLQGANRRIDQSDAHLVEIIHTSSLGLVQPVGDVDFYPNGGNIKQPGCGLDPSDTCSHGRSYYYYAESLTHPDSWYAVRCDTNVDFLQGKCEGNEIAPFPRWSAEFKRTPGTYKLRTNGTAPYGLGLAGTKPPPSPVNPQVIKS